MSTRSFIVAALAAAFAFYGAIALVNNDYLFYASYVVLQFVVIATAWNILGGYCGYVNFGSAAFFAMGVYSSVAVIKLAADDGWFATAYNALPFTAQLPVLVLFAGALAGVIGLGTGYLTLRLRGVFFSIATLALAVVLQTLVVNWRFVGGSRGAYIVRPAEFPIPGGFVGFLLVVMLLITVFAVVTARTIERSKLGYGFAAIRDDEAAAEASGVPTLRLKLVATTLSGALMGMAGAPFPYYIGFVEPASTFGLGYAVNAIAMPMIGGTSSWAGPIIGALVLGTFQQVATVTISSAANLLIVGLLLIAFVILAPNGIIGFVKALRQRGGTHD